MKTRKASPSLAAAATPHLGLADHVMVETRQASSLDEPLASWRLRGTRVRHDGWSGSLVMRSASTCTLRAAGAGPAAPTATPQKGPRIRSEMQRRKRHAVSPPSGASQSKHWPPARRSARSRLPSPSVVCQAAAVTILVSLTAGTVHVQRGSESCPIMIFFHKTPICTSNDIFVLWKLEYRTHME